MSGREPQGGGFEITPEEDRFLRAFFHRHAGRYLAVVGLLAAAGLCAALFAGPGAEAGSGLDERQALEIDALRAENQKLRAKLASLGERVDSHDAAAERLGALEQRVAGALRRLDRAESRVRESAASGGPDAPAWDVGVILERLQSLEQRQERQTQQAEAFQQGVMRRVYDVERLADERAPGAEPAAPAP